ncbi:hypothetical protein BDF21DRAFT_405171 [Thamnidium elegans]|nr:hypothetical protein BDF21DRAFT_405171 [Thamnidium elegans]
MTATVPLNLERFNYHLRLHNIFSKAITVQGTKRAYREQIVSREQLCEFYGSRKRASAKEKSKVGLQISKPFITEEIKEMKEDKKRLVMFIGDRGTGAGSTIKGYRRHCISIRNNRNLEFPQSATKSILLSVKETGDGIFSVIQFTQNMVQDEK